MQTKYAKLISNDVVNCDSGICVSLWMQGCPHHCPSCHNPKTWNFSGGITIETEVLIQNILQAIKANGINRQFSILGGEPLAPQNIKFTKEICQIVKQSCQNIQIYIWTGYEFNEIDTEIYELADVIIDGPFIQEQKDLNLKLRGSKNQHIYRKNQNGIWYMEE